MSFSGTKEYLTKPKPGAMLNPLHPLSKGLVGYWLFNEGSGSLANDISGKGNHGRLTNMAPNAQGSGWGGSKFGGGLQFDGVDDYVDCGDLSEAEDEILTIEVWLKTTQNGTDMWIVSEGSTVSDIPIIGIINHGGVLKGFWRNNANANLNKNGTTVINDGFFHHLVMTADGSTASIYVDANLENSGSLPGGIYSLNTTSIGALHRASVSNFVNGSIRFVNIYNRALSAAEVKQRCLNPFCNLLQVPIRRYSVVAPPVGAIMNQFQGVNVGADLYNGVILA